ncbi:MAG: efflux RND transporter permease subunit, partial [Deltaproteobacteria bacterium]|nr:efflux RND transporter permease subunit [Deltaproteobacteria bacterium]
MKLISFFVHRPIATMMILFIFLFFGILSLFKIPVDLFPNVSHPHLSIVTKYENASAEEIEKNITKPLEDELSFLKNLSYLSSVSEEGVSRIQLTFHWGTRMDFAALEAREKIDLVKSKLPEDAQDPIVERYNPNAQPVLMVNLLGSGAQKEEGLRSIADGKLKPALERILGVAQVKVFGGAEKMIEVALNPHQLKAYRLSTQNIIDALKSSNVSSRGGTLREGKIDLLIKTSAKFNSIEDILDTIITKKNQAPIYLKHMATVQSALKIKKDYAFLNGKPSVALAITKEPSGNTLSISKQFQSLKQSLEKEAHITLVSTYDQSDYIQNSISMVQSNALQGALLTILVLFVFLKNFATTFIIVVSIPFAITCSFFLLYLNGVTLNIFSLAGIALALGMVVDASIVILENIFEHLKTEERPKNAAIHATVEVAGAVIASTLTTLAVFIPILFVKGPIGIIFKDLSLSIIYGLIFSMIIAFSFVPMIAAQLLKQTSSEGIKEKIDRWGEIVLQGLWILDRIYHLGTKMVQAYEKFLKRFTLTPKELYKKALEQSQAGEKKIEELQITVEKQYERTLKEAIQSWKSRVSVIVVVFIIFFISLFFIPKTEFLPEALQNHYELTLEYPPGTSLDTTTESCKKIEAFIRSLSNISSTHLKVVAGQGTFLIKFSKPKKAQKRLAHLRAYLEKIPDTYFTITALSPLSSVTAGLETRVLDLKLKGPEMKVLQKKGKFLAEELKKVWGVRSTYLSYEESKPEIVIKIDRDKASDVGLTSRLIADNLKNQLYGVKATTLSSSEGTEWPIMVKSKTGALDTYQKLGDLLIPSPYGIHIPLQTIAGFEER